MVEFVVTLGLGGILLTVIAALTLYSGRSMAAMVNYVDLNQRSRMALDLMTRDIRQASRVLSFAETSEQISLQLQEVVITATNSQTFVTSYIYYKPNFSIPEQRKTVVRTRTGEPSKLLLTDCETLEFTMYKRTQEATTDPTRCKMVQVNWVCARKVLGALSNTESIQTAKIVIRKQTGTLIL